MYAYVRINIYIYIYIYIYYIILYVHIILERKHRKWTLPKGDITFMYMQYSLHHHVGVYPCTFLSGDVDVGKEFPSPKSTFTGDVRFSL